MTYPEGNVIDLQKKKTRKQITIKRKRWLFREMEEENEKCA